MKCAHPYALGVEKFRCGKCLPCLSARRTLWTSRLMLESTQHQVSCFVTLTYDNVNLPVDGSVDVRHLQLFLKRVRERVWPCLIRFFGVGEYGDLSGRPHYHVVLFGTDDAVAIGASWNLGFVHVGTLTDASASYICKYTTKGMTRGSDPRLKGKRPEFSRMSLRPGIGAGATQSIADAVTTKGGAVYVARTGDVPGALRQGKGSLQLGRYLRRRVREQSGLDAAESVEARALRLLKEQARLLQPGEREKDEGRRIQSERKAIALNQISRSKKGIGI